MKHYIWPPPLGLGSTATPGYPAVPPHSAQHEVLHEMSTSVLHEMSTSLLHSSNELQHVETCSQVRAQLPCYQVTIVTVTNEDTHDTMGSEDTQDDMVETEDNNSTLREERGNKKDIYHVIYQHHVLVTSHQSGDQPC